MSKFRQSPFEREEMETAKLKSRRTWGDRKVGDLVGHRRDPANYKTAEGCDHADQMPETIFQTAEDERVFGVIAQHPPRKG